MTRLALAAALGLGLTGPGWARAQDNGHNVAVETDYRVGPGDVLEVEVFDDPDLSVSSPSSTEARFVPPTST
jgi:protein involved in polysaccharide export with SLBB domain